MGLRDLQAFNKSLLAKQGWRLIRNEDSLFARTLRERYYPHGTFMSASLCHNSSYVWQSIIEERKVLELGLVWVIGNGQSVRFWQDPWLVTRAISYVNSDKGECSMEMAIRDRDLMTDDYCGWNAHHMSQVFYQRRLRKYWCSHFSRIDLICSRGDLRKRGSTSLDPATSNR